MKKIIFLFKNLKDKLNIKLMEILLEAEKPQLPKELRNDLDNFFELFGELNLLEKIIVIIIFCMSTLYLIFLVLRVYSLLSK